MQQLILLLAMVVSGRAVALDCPAASGQPRPPTYPPALQAAGVGGTTKRMITVDACGRAADVQVRESSGHAELDDAAADAARGWHFQPGSGTVLVPVDFRPEAPRSTDATAGDARAARAVPAFLATSKQPATGPKFAANDRIPGYVPDSRPLGFDSVSAAKDYLADPCGGPEAASRGCQVQVIRESPRVVQVVDSCDVSYWSDLDAESGMGPAIVRDRFYFTTAGGSHIRTSSICEGSAMECKALVDFLHKRADQPQPGPPPPPPPSGAMCGISGG